MNSRIVVGTFALALVTGMNISPAYALTLAETVQHALKRNPANRLPEARIEVGKGYRKQADSLLGGDPAIDLSLTGDTLGSDSGYVEYIAGISVPVWLPGRRSAKAAIADNLYGQATAEKRRLAWEVVGEVLGLAWALRIARMEMKQSMKQWAASRALVQDIRHRYEVGELSRNDLLLVQQDLVETETAYQEAVSAAEQASMAWRNYTGLDELPEDLQAMSVHDREPPIDKHPQLSAALAAAATAMALANDARAQRRALPLVSLFAKRDRGDRHEDYTDSLGIAVSLPLGTRGASAPAIAEAEAERTTAEVQVRLLQRELELRQLQADQEVEKATRLLQLAEQNNKYSRSRLKLAQRAFELGEMDLYQLLLARRQSYQSNRDFRLRSMEKQRALAMRNHLLGVIPE